MKLSAIIAATLLSASAASASDYTGVYWGAEVDTFYDFDAASVQSTLSPELVYTVGNASFFLGTDLNLITSGDVVVQDAFDNVVLDFGVETYLSDLNGAVVYGTVDYDVTSNTFSGAKVGVSFAF